MKKLKYILVGVLFSLSVGLFAQVPAVPSSLQTILKGKYVVSTGYEENDILSFEKAMDNDRYLDAAITLNDAELEALSDTNDAQTVILNNHEGRVDDAEADIINMQDTLVWTADSIGDLKDTAEVHLSRLDSTASKQLGWYDVRDYGAIAGDGLNDSTGINAAIRAAAALPDWGDNPTVFIPWGRWNLSGPIILKDKVSLLIDDNAAFLLPSGYTGAAILAEDGEIHTRIKVHGGYFIESTPKSYAWKGIHIDKETSSSYYMVNCTFENIRFQDVGTILHIDIDNNGFVNDNNFLYLYGANFIEGIDAVDGSGNSQFRGNKIIGCGWQAGTMTDFVFNDTDDKNLYSGNVVWDIDNSDSADVRIVTNASGLYHSFEGNYFVPTLDPPSHEAENSSYDYKIAYAAIDYTQDGAMDTIAYLSNTAIVWDVQIRVNTNFNDSGTDYMLVGTSTDDNYFLNNEDVSTGSPVFVDVTQLVAPRMIWNNNYITATYNGENSDATAGAARIYVFYSIK